MTRPLCRYCGKPIAKKTVWHPVNGKDPDPPLSKADCQARTNEIVTSVQYGNPWRPHDPDSKIRFVRSFYTWDGESYADRFFCNGAHARDFAYAAASMQPPIAMRAYFDALKEKEKAT